VVQWSGEKRRMQLFRGALPDSGSPPHGMRKLRSMMPLPSRAAFKKVSVWLHTYIKSYCTAMQIPFIYSFSRNSAASGPNYPIHMSVSDLSIPWIGPHISYS
jgi:hypothetical protein